MPPKAYYFPSIPSNLYTTTEQTAAALVQRAAPAYERTTSLIIFFVFLLSNLNRRLMCSLNEWRQRMKEQLLLQVRGLILHGTPTPGGATTEPLTASSLFAQGSARTHTCNTRSHAHAESARQLWAHYACAEVLAQLADQSLHSPGQV